MGRRVRGRHPATTVSSTGPLNKFSEIFFFFLWLSGSEVGVQAAPQTLHWIQTEWNAAATINLPHFQLPAEQQTWVICCWPSNCVFLSVPLPPAGSITLDLVHTDLGSSHQLLILSISCTEPPSLNLLSHSLCVHVCVGALAWSPMARGARVNVEVGPLKVTPRTPCRDNEGFNFATQAYEIVAPRVATTRCRQNNTSDVDRSLSSAWLCTCVCLWFSRMALLWLSKPRTSSGFKAFTAVGGVCVCACVCVASTLELKPSGHFSTGLIGWIEVLNIGFYYCLHNK